MEKTMEATCGWFRHQWAKWTDKDAGTVLNGGNDVVGRMIVQERRCSHCNMVQLRTAKTTL